MEREEPRGWWRATARGPGIEEEVDSVSQLMARSASVPMALADACLVRMSELHDDAVVFTVDGDFGIYRRHGRRVIKTISPH